MFRAPKLNFREFFFQKLSDKSLEGSRASVLVALKAAKWRFWLRTDHSWEPRVRLIWNFQTVSLETVWKIRMGPTLRFHELEEGSQKHPYPRFALPKTRDPDLSSYFPNSFSTTFS